MPLPTPILDDRSWQQLRDELVRRIPVYNPEWTDHNASDPGITLLELFAYLGETLLFRFNQIPEATRLEFLRLLRVPMRPAVPARAMVALSIAQPHEVLVPIGTETKAGNVSFETGDEVNVFPLLARAVRKETAPAPTGEEAKIYADAAIEAVRAAGDLTEGEVPVYYVSDVLPEDPSVPGFQARDFGATVDGILWVAVLKTKDTDLARLGDALLNLGFIPDPVILDMEDVEGCPGAGNDEPTDEVSWEISTAEARNGKPYYAPLVVAGDTTRGLARQGVVRLRLPHDPLTGGIPAFDDPDLEGTGDLPPVLDDEELTADLLFWIRAYRRKSGRPLGRVLWVGANASEVTQVRTARTELLGTGNGGAAQTFALANRPLVAGSLQLQVEEEGGWTPWTEVDDFAGWGRDDRVFVVDLEAGEVRFGNGTTGKAPQIGERVRASSYRYGGGAAGNVAAKAITKVTGVAGVKASNPRRAYGGADAESVADAVERIPGELRRHDRAVTASDFRELALQAPGAGVGRAEVLPRFHPPSKQDEAAGIVTVVVWPAEDLQHPNAPMPDRDLLKCVCAWLDARRLVTTELYVIPPTYRKVAVSVGVVVKPGYGIEAVNAWVELVIRQYLAPLPPFGPSGGGWPLGRRVHGPELAAAALQVDGVEYLEDLKVAGWEEVKQGDGTVTGSWKQGTVELEAWEVVELTDITVVRGTPPEP
ncbi:MAG TPA: putative baseplate assembly protein, partial [Longimicrobiaceae bacterium]|nr:putative baseplate assembly protein [Longimicrobiaceae bacterium]